MRAASVARLSTQSGRHHAARGNLQRRHRPPTPRVCTGCTPVVKQSTQGALEAAGTSLTANGIDFAVGPGQRGGFNLAREAGSGKTAGPFLRPALCPPVPLKVQQTNARLPEGNGAVPLERDCMLRKRQCRPHFRRRTRARRLQQQQHHRTRTNLCTRRHRPLHRLRRRNRRVDHLRGHRHRRGEHHLRLRRQAPSRSPTPSPRPTSPASSSRARASATPSSTSRARRPVRPASASPETATSPFTGFTIQNTLGDGIKVEGGNGVLFDTVQVQLDQPQWPLPTARTVSTRCRARTSWSRTAR